MSPHEPRCHQKGMDARRRDAAKAGRLGKKRNDADARFGDNPSGAGPSSRFAITGPFGRFEPTRPGGRVEWRSALLPRPDVYQHTASSAPSSAPRAPRSRSCGLLR